MVPVQPVGEVQDEARSPTPGRKPAAEPRKEAMLSVASTSPLKMTLFCWQKLPWISFLKAAQEGLIEPFILQVG